jgi:uncharacterized protein (TIGR03086 family)
MAGSGAHARVMTTTNPTTTTTSVLAADDPRITFNRAVALATGVIAGVRPDQLALPTPCEEYDVRDLLGHLVMVLDRVAALGRGEDAFTDWAPLLQPDDGWVTAWQAAAVEAERAWADDAVLTRTITVPWASVPGAQVLDTYTNEVTVHTWDLASATGQEPEWDEQVVAVAGATMQRFLPDAHREAFIPFADAVEVGADANPMDRLVAWNGRSPQRR